MQLGIFGGSSKFKTLADAKCPGGAPSKLSNGTLLRDTVRPATKAYVAAAFTAVVYIQYSSAGSKDDAQELRHAFCSLHRFMPNSTQFVDRLGRGNQPVEKFAIKGLVVARLRILAR